jgi:hypothetical protein
LRESRALVPIDLAVAGSVKNAGYTLTVIG